MRSCSTGSRQLLGELAAASNRTPGVQLQVNLVDLLRFPGVLRENSADPEALPWPQRALFAKSLADLKSMRASEGARLKELIEQRCDAARGIGDTGAHAVA